MMSIILKTKRAIAVTFTGISILSITSQATANPQFFENMLALCGTKFVGEMTFSTEGQDSFRGQKLVADIANCKESKISIPFHVGEDHSRTWHISNTDTGLTLKHEHRHHDGRLDRVTDYGGHADDFGTNLSQSFPADQHTKQLIPAAASNVWTITLSADKRRLTYHLERHNKPRFTAVLTIED